MDLNPSNSKIRVVNNPLKGSPEKVYKKLREITEVTLEENLVVIGYVSHKGARPRFKSYEKHKGLDVQEIEIIYVSDYKKDVTKIESELINEFWEHENCCNKRHENQREEDLKDSKYYVYLAIGI